MLWNAAHQTCDFAFVPRLLANPEGVRNIEGAVSTWGTGRRVSLPMWKGAAADLITEHEEGTSFVSACC